MYVLKKSLYLELKLLINKFYLFILFIFSIAYFLYGYDIVAKKVLFGTNVIRTAGFLMMGLTLLSFIFGIINARQEQVVKFEEVLDTLPAFWIRHSAKVLAWMIICFLYCIFLTGALLFCFAKDHTGLSKYGLEIFLYIILNFGLPMISCWLFGYSFERLLSSRIGWPLLFILWYIIMPFEKSYQIHSFFNSFNQFVEQPSGSVDLIHYGLEMNFGLLERKIWLLFFGLVIYIITLLLKFKLSITKNKKSMIALIAAVSLFLLSLPMAYYASGFHSPSSLWGLNWEKETTELYKQSTENLNYPQIAVNGEIDLLEIEIQKQRDNLLTYKAIVSVKNVISKPLVFTLYRSLNVQNIKVNGVSSASFSRVKDLLIIPPSNVGNVIIELNVSGELPLSIGEITSRTLALTPDVPWYPILGEYKVLNPILQEAYMTNNLTSNHLYKIKIKSFRGPIITNLSSQKGIQFEGMAYGPTIIQGQYEVGTVNGIDFVAPTQLFHYYKNSIILLAKQLEKQEKHFNNISNLPNRTTLHSYKKIFFIHLREQSQNLPANVFKSIHSEAYFDYRIWLNPTYYDSADKSLLLKSEMTKQCSFFEWYLQDTYHPIHPFRAFFLFDLLSVMDTGNARFLSERINEITDEDKGKSLNDLKDLEKVIQSTTTKETQKQAQKLLIQWMKE